jgi:hypothetical protein
MASAKIVSSVKNKGGGNAAAAAAALSYFPMLTLDFKGLFTPPSILPTAPRSSSLVCQTDDGKGFEMAVVCSGGYTVNYRSGLLQLHGGAFGKLEQARKVA